MTGAVRSLADLISAPAQRPTRVVEIVHASPSAAPNAGAVAPIPGAVRLSAADFAGAEGPTTGRQPLPNHARLAATLTAAGITPSTALVVVPRSLDALSTAARGWVTLRWAGIADVVVLAPDPHVDADAQLDALAQWAAESGEAADTSTPLERNDSVVTTADAVSRRDGTVILIDARSPEAFGDDDAHIAGSVNLPTAALLEAGALTDAEALRRTYRETLGVDPHAQPLIVSCGSGISASVQALALAQAGVAAPVYIGSWSEWSKRESSLTL